MNKDFPYRLREIYHQVDEMSYSKENLIEIILLFKETIRIQKEINRHRSKNPCLNNLLNTFEKEYKEMISNRIISEAEMADNFHDFRTNFLTDLSMFCSDSDTF